jgi:hypothetical protein
MRGFMPRIRVVSFRLLAQKDVDGRDKPGHDEAKVVNAYSERWIVSTR